MLNIDFVPDAVILGGGDYPTHRIPKTFLQMQVPLVCCDGAANQCAALELHPWRIIGDGDSLSTETKQQFSEIIRVFPDQDTNDQTKAVNYLVHKGMKRIAILAATGRREDHTLGNISLLMEYFRKGLDVRIYTDYGVFIPCRDTNTFDCPVGTAVSIFSFGTKQMSSEGLAYPLYDFSAWWQGTLNHSVKSPFQISCHGNYLVYLCYENVKERK